METRKCDHFDPLEKGEDSNICVGKCLKSKKIVHPAVCYTCNKNTLILGYGFNGQGA